MRSGDFWNCWAGENHALSALATIRCERCLFPIVAALREPSLVQDAAWELGQMAPPTRCRPGPAGRDQLTQPR
jgi:hypothetical protein